MRTVKKRSTAGRALAEYDGHRTVIGTMVDTEAPDYAVGIGREIHRFIALGVMATTALAYGFATTVVVGDQVIAIIDWISARSDPADG